MTKKEKWTQSRKFILNPEWEGSDDHIDEAFRLSPDLRSYWSLVPSECGCKLPEAGAWIMVKRPPHTEYTVPALSFWYAVEELRPHGVAGQAYHLAKIVTPRGSLFLHPDEYSIVKDMSAYMEMPEDHVRIHHLGGSSANPDAIFYLRSRGIGRAQAIKMLLGNVKSQDVAYITTHPEYANVFGFEQPEAEHLACSHEDPEKVILGEHFWQELQQPVATV